MLSSDLDLVTKESFLKEVIYDLRPNEHLSLGDQEGLCKN